jgi:hypothetical protein
MNGTCVDKDQRPQFPCISLVYYALHAILQKKNHRATDMIVGSLYRIAALQKYDIEH